jgi:hypothetical protein
MLKQGYKTWGVTQTIISKKKNKKRRLWSHDMKTSTWTRGLANSKTFTEEKGAEL